MLIIVGYLIFQIIVARMRSNQNKIIITDYKLILENKLMPLTFERHQDYEDALEKVISYKRDNLHVTLYFGTPPLVPEIYATSGKKQPWKGESNKCRRRTRLNSGMNKTNIN